MILGWTDLAELKEQHVCIKFCTKLSIRGILQCLNKHLAMKTTDRTQTFKCFSCLCERSTRGHLNNRSQSIHNIYTIFWPVFWYILIEEFNMRQTATKFMSCLLTWDQRQHRLTVQQPEAGNIIAEISVPSLFWFSFLQFLPVP